MAFLTDDERNLKLDELEEKFTAYIRDQRERLKTERALLKLVLDNQGFSNSARRNANTDKLSSLATVKELLPNFELNTES
jgi:hypothetical protein